MQSTLKSSIWWCHAYRLITEVHMGSLKVKVSLKIICKLNYTFCKGFWFSYASPYTSALAMFIYIFFGATAAYLPYLTSSGFLY